MEKELKKVAIIDTPYDFYRNRFAKPLSVKRLINGVEQEFPTGHVYGLLEDVIILSQNHDVVFLSLDSSCDERKKVLSNYKSDRHAKTGDFMQDYNIYNDLIPSLKLCTYISNVYYIKEEQMESDDILASFMLASNKKSEWDLHCYFSDDDILQTSGVYIQHKRVTGVPEDRGAHISSKYGVVSDFLPFTYKVIRGDTSDKIPPALPRFPQESMHWILSNTPSDTFDFDVVLSLLKKCPIRGAWNKKIADALKSEDSDIVKALKRNWIVTHPRTKMISEMKFKKLGATKEECSKLLDYYRIKSELITSVFA